MADDTGKDRRHWTDVAEAWIAWARKPGHDAFWAYRNSLIDYIGSGPGSALDVGCGEGRVARLLTECGFQVTACDPVDRFVEAARIAGSAHRYATCAADDLPFPDQSFDLVVAYNVLMDIENVPAALNEMRRVLHPGGTMMISIVHPFADIGRFADDTPGAPFVITEPYFGRKGFQGSETRNGLTMPFFGWSQPLQDYVAALAAAGLAIVSLREPVPEPGPDMEHLQGWTRLPLFLWLKARALAEPPPAA